MRGWLEGYLAALQPRPVRWDDRAKFASIERKHILYSEMERHEAWLDYTHRLSQVKEGLERDLLLGTVDTHGKTHDDEKRAALHVVNVMMEYVPAIHRNYEDSRTNVERWEAKRKSLSNAV